MQTSHPLGRAGRRTFAAVVRAATGEAAGEEVADAIAPFLARLPRSDLLQLRALLFAIEYAVPLLTLRPGRFTTLPPARQEAYLASWASSRLAQRRQGAAVLKSLASLACYGREDAWPHVGYDGPWLGRVDVPVLPAPELGRGAPESLAQTVRPRPAGAQSPATPALALGRDAATDLHLRAQAVVIGLGAGGAAALARLAEAGVDVVGLEAGGAPSAAEYSQRELEMLPLLYQDAGLRATADKAIGILQGRGVGGSTLHNTGLVYAPPTGVLERWREEHGFAVPPAEWDARIADVLSTLHAVPIPRDRINPNNDVLRRGAEHLGWRYRVALHNRVECSGCGYCMLGCAYNRKSNAALTYIPRALAAGARILADAAAVRIEGRRGARRVVCNLVDRAGRPTGRRAVAEADIVLVAAGALDTPALLRRSGLAGRRIGRGLRLHPAASVLAAFPEEIVAWRGVPQAVLVEEFATFFDDGRGGFLLIPNPATTPGLLGTLVPGIGAAHAAILRDYARLASAFVLLHDETAGRVHVGPGGRPVARYWPDAADMRELFRGIHALARLYLAAGAVRVHLPFTGSPPVHDERELDHALARARPARFALALNSVHPQGSCAIGPDPAHGAVRPSGEIWGASGVFVCDTSLFPTSVGVPPQVTAMALGAVVADHAREALR